MSVCGLNCSECDFFGKTCEGCIQVKGQTFWAREHMPNQTCPLYQCSVNECHYRHCGDCAELPCSTFREMKDPNSTEEEHKESLKRRVETLKN